VMPFDLQPRLFGRFLHLRPLCFDDLEPLYAAAADPLIWEQHPTKERYKREVFEEFFRESIASRGALVAIDCQSNRIVGSSRFHGCDEANSEIEIGWTFLTRSHWGGEYNGEMKRLMLEHAFKFNRVVLLVGPQNLPIAPRRRKDWRRRCWLTT